MTICEEEARRVLSCGVCLLRAPPIDDLCVEPWDFIEPVVRAWALAWPSVWPGVRSLVGGSGLSPLYIFIGIPTQSREY